MSDGWADPMEVYKATLAAYRDANPDMSDVEIREETISRLGQRELQKVAGAADAYPDTATGDTSRAGLRTAAAAAGVFGGPVGDDRLFQLTEDGAEVLEVDV